MKRDHLAPIGMIALGLGAMLSALLGPLALGIIEWRATDNMENQILGGELAALFLAGPIAIVAGVLWFRAHRLGPVLALGPAFFGLYTYPSLILGPEYDRYAGNNEQAFPLYITLTILSWSTGAVAWSKLGQQPVPPIPQRLRRVGAAIMLVVGVTFLLAWSGQIAQVIAGDTSGLSEYQEHPTVFWVIKTFDLGFVVPLLLATGVGLVRNHRLAVKAAYGLVAGVTLLASAVSGMGVIMLVTDDPAATVVLPAVTIPITITAGALSIALYRVYLDDASYVPTTALPHRGHDVEHRRSPEVEVS